MRKEGIPSRSSLEAHDVGEGLCEDPVMNKYQPFIRHSCIKILGESSTQMMQEFAGDVTAQDLEGRLHTFQRKRRVSQSLRLTTSLNNNKQLLFCIMLQVCVKQLKACPRDEFIKANMTTNHRYSTNELKNIAQ